ncbi:MAG: GerMN domain-containing protein [Bacillota bacterium]|nr:GerMN domain-containing protein [Bacillota bacterium]MDW7670938.1 GerMN domain-containing protein [Bacillota bacterium]
MRYLVKILLLLLALSFVGAGMPLYLDTIDINRESSFEEGSAESLDMSYALRQLNESHYEIDVWVDASPDQAALLTTYPNAFNVQLFSSDDEVRQLSNEEQAWVLQDVDEKTGLSRYISTLSLEQQALDLPDGHYRLMISPADARNLFQETLDVPDIPFQFTSVTEYVQAQQDLPVGVTPLTLYFPDASSNYLIPVTRFVPQTTTTLRETVTQLERGPSPDLALFNRSPIPPVPRIQLSGGTASLYLSSQLGFYNEYSNVARMAAKSLVESLGGIPEVNRVQFYFDNRIAAEGFRDVSTDAPIEPAEPPFIYAVYRAPNGRGFLIPRSTENPLISVPEIFRALTYEPSANLYGFEVQPAVPREVKLLDSTLENSILQINLSSEFNQVFLENPARGYLMLDALLYSLTSLDQVDSVVLLIDGRVPDLLLDRPLSEPLTASLFINPENNF